MSVPHIVLDSNVIISGLLFEGHPSQILKLILQGSLVCFISIPILDEVRDVLQRPKFKLSSEQVLTLVEELHEVCELVTLNLSLEAVEDDPDDNRILECALAAEVNVIISGDSDLINLKQWDKIRILTPAEFIRELDL